MEIKYFGVGNESWGFGGYMRLEYNTDPFSRIKLSYGNIGIIESTKLPAMPLI